MISVIVMFFVALAFAFITNQDLESAKNALSEAQTAEAEAKERLLDEVGQFSTVCEKVGWTGEDSGRPRTDIDAMELNLQGLRDALGITDGTVSTVQGLLPLIVAKHDSISKELQTARGRLKTLNDELASERSSLADVTRAKDAELAQLRQQIIDDRQKADDQESDLTQRIARANQLTGAAEAETSRIKDEKEEALRAAAKKEEKLQNINRGLSSALRFQQEPERPDGEVLATSAELNLGWINLGKRNRLSAGTRFRVVSDVGSKMELKAWATVTSVENSMAEVRFDSVVDSFNPVAKGDLVFNPLFDPIGERNAVLAGRFSSPGEKDMIAFLRNMGITVQPELKDDTHYLVVGSALYTDEDGENLEEPIQPSELPVYQEAESRGLVIVPLHQIRTFFSL